MLNYGGFLRADYGEEGRWKDHPICRKYQDAFLQKGLRYEQQTEPWINPFITNKRQSEVVIKLTNMWIHGVDPILDWRMKNRAAARIKKIIYGVSIGGLPLQVAKT